MGKKGPGPCTKSGTEDAVKRFDKSSPDREKYEHVFAAPPFLVPRSARKRASKFNKSRPPARPNKKPTSLFGFALRRLLRRLRLAGVHLSRAAKIVQGRQSWKTTKRSGGVGTAEQVPRFSSSRPRNPTKDHPMEEGPEARSGPSLYRMMMMMTVVAEDRGRTANEYADEDEEEPLFLPPSLFLLLLVPQLPQQFCARGFHPNLLPPPHSKAVNRNVTQFEGRIRSRRPERSRHFRS